MPAARAKRPLPRGVTTSGSKACRKHAQRGQIAGVVVVVTEEHGRNRRQRVESDRGRPDAPRSQALPRAGVLRINRVGEDISGGGLNQERRVPDESDDRLADAPARHSVDPERLQTTAPQLPPAKGGLSKTRFPIENTSQFVAANYFVVPTTVVRARFYPRARPPTDRPRRRDRPSLYPEDFKFRRVSRDT
jgi:hypothetical protein